MAKLPRTLALAELLRTDDELRASAAVMSRRHDGAGAQALGIIAALLFSRRIGVRYTHKKFRDIEHTPQPKVLWAKKWERFFNFGEGESGRVPGDKVVRVPAYLAGPEAYRGLPVVLRDGHFYNFASSLPDGYDSIAPELRERYWRSPKGEIPNHGRSGALTVAIHVRRGDITSDASSHHHRVTADPLILRTVGELRRALSDKPHVINIYSQGEPEAFRAFVEAGCVLQLDVDPFVSFHNLVIADVLVTARSAFSYVAAILSEGAVIWEPWQHPKSPHWIKLARNGSFSVNALRLRINREAEPGLSDALDSPAAVPITPPNRASRFAP